MNVTELRAAVLARYRSIHAFCKAHAELKRATVYLVLSGKYPGNTARQEAQIREALGDIPPAASPVPPERIAEVLQACKCAHCRRPNRRGCRGCRNQTAREVAALTEYLKADGSRERQRADSFKAGAVELASPRILPPLKRVKGVLL